METKIVGEMINDETSERYDAPVVITISETEDDMTIKSGDFYLILNVDQVRDILGV